LCCPVDVSDTGRSLFQRSPTAYMLVCHWVWSGATVPSTPTVSTQMSEWEIEICVSFTWQCGTCIHNMVTAVVHKQLP